MGLSSISPALPDRSALIGPAINWWRRRGRSDSEPRRAGKMVGREGEGEEVRRGRRSSRGMWRWGHKTQEVKVTAAAPIG